MVFESESGLATMTTENTKTGPFNSLNNSIFMWNFSTESGAKSNAIQKIKIIQSYLNRKYFTLNGIMCVSCLTYYTISYDGNHILFLCQYTSFSKLHYCNIRITFYFVYNRKVETIAHLNIKKFNNGEKNIVKSNNKVQKVRNVERNWRERRRRRKKKHNTLTVIHQTKHSLCVLLSLWKSNRNTPEMCSYSISLFVELFFFYLFTDMKRIYWRISNTHPPF